jgi:pyrroloquinoline quinone biosynthesis protein D
VTLTPQTILRRQPGADATVLGGEVVVLDASGKMVRALNATAARVWQLLDGSHTVQDICSTLLAEFDASAEAIEADVFSFLEYLHRVELVAGESR